jgi:uncharacterized protein YjgD (DUF1641 family)
MAKPLDYTPQAALPASNTASDLLQALEEHRVLEGLRLLVEGGSEALALLLNHWNRPENQRSLENLARLVQLITHLDARLIEGLNRGLQLASERTSTEPPGTLELLRGFNDPEVRRGLYVLQGLLKGLGRG